MCEAVCTACSLTQSGLQGSWTASDQVKCKHLSLRFANNECNWCEGKNIFQKPLLAQCVAECHYLSSRACTHIIKTNKAFLWTSQEGAIVTRSTLTSLCCSFCWSFCHLKDCVKGIWLNRCLTLHIKQRTSPSPYQCARSHFCLSIHLITLHNLLDVPCKYRHLHI